MPTYEYECDGCHRVFEVRQRISEPALTTCEVCGGSVRRLLSAAPFILKGEGWYVTDYPSEARKKAMKSEKSTTETKAETKSDSDSSAKPAASSAKPAAKPDGGSGGTSSAASSGASTKSD